MASGEVVIQSMWSPAITAVKSRGDRNVSISRWKKVTGLGAAVSACPNLTGLRRRDAGL